MSSLDSLGLPSLPPLQPLEELGFGTLPPAAAAAAQPAGEWFGFSDWGDVDAPTIHAQADASGDTSPQRGDEPYRRALRGVYARLAATYPILTGEAPPRHPQAHRRAGDVRDEAPVLEG